MKKYYGVLCVTAALCVACVNGMTLQEGFAAGAANPSDYGPRRVMFQGIAKDDARNACIALRVAADCLHRLGKTAEAKAELAGLIQSYASETGQVETVYCTLASICRETGDYPEALRLCDTVLDKYPSMPYVIKQRVLAQKANAYMASGNAEQAVAELERATQFVDTTASTVWLYRRLYDAYMKVKNVAGAQNALRRGILDNARFSGDETATLFERINPGVGMDIAAYKTFLYDVLLRVPAVEANAKFLGRVKSELEKIK